MKLFYPIKMFTTFLLLSAATAVYSQTGLQNVIVEKYYISDYNDSVGSIGRLPVGSVTYRIFLDMKPGYKFQSAYGSPSHTMFIKTTTAFFNNEDRGSTTPAFTKSQAKFNTVMLDSWLTAGAACTANFGVLKSVDDGVGTVVNADGLLQNNNPMAGIPLTSQDGFLSGTPGTFSSIGIDEAILVFDAESQAGNSFLTTNGAWSCLSGATGPDSSNIVLIAQVTTEGELSFELNIQIGTPDGGTEQYVARNPVGSETMFPGLTYNSTLTDLKPLNPVVDAEQMQMNVYPNPCQDKITLSTGSLTKAQLCSFSLCDAKGQILIHKEFSSDGEKLQMDFDVSAYPSGLYFALLTADGVTLTRKLIRQ
jgi:hypothetical protein